MADDPSANLVERWRAGDKQAATQLFERYADRLIALARSRLPPKLSQRVDPEDVVQSVYRSFFAETRDGRYDFQRGGDLWRLLVTMTLHKLQNQVKHNCREKRSVDREQRFGSEDSLLRLQADVVHREPSPIEAAVLAEQLEQLMRRLDLLYRRVVELRLQGCTLEGIAVAVQRSERTVCRILEEVKQHLECGCAESSGS
jgi:RNA polymerase sigma-70 factor (ECF subfamily)